MGSIVRNPRIFAGYETYIGQTERRFAQTEKSFMSCGYIPIISSVTGPMRAVMGLFQTVTFSALSASSLISGKKAISIRHVYTAGNGVVNICRGAIEAVPIFGNLVCYSYDSCCRPIQYIGQRTDDFALKVRLMSQVEVSIGHTPDLSPIQRLIQRRHS